ncbi:MAG: Lrp/AsnC ligand binding domain-containing protein [Aigarchaeota archaeon]|nr:Lrp/AsnC ligand binding domain-containing protein [Aigarchaeota archaeon]MCX8192341.1 Lrp/AsnC ligand binding domain-containing protein [Nitrososphaeria archaeon]MDW7986865.1 Lrp/AsnC ligand binding domain-containing protein [Nitrososphaerota archaeon]
MKAFVLSIISPRSGLVQALNAVKSSRMVKEAYLIYGTYDLICKIEFDNLTQVDSFLEVLQQHGLQDSNTLIVKEGGLSFEKERASEIEKCAYIFGKIRRPSVPKFWEAHLKSIEPVLEAHELYGLYDVVIGVREDVRADFYNQVFKQLWLLTEVNLTATHTMFTVKL